ncbi:unnamed protein product [Umbelopsis sp. WA50703]
MASSSSAPSSKRNSRLSYGVAPIDPPFDQELPEEWELEKEDDGRFHYYNKNTGEMRQAQSLHTDVSTTNSANLSTNFTDMDSADRDRDLQSSVAESLAMSHSYLDQSTDASFRSFGSISEQHSNEKLSSYGNKDDQVSETTHPHDAAQMVSTNLNGNTLDYSSDVDRRSALESRNAKYEDNEWQTSWAKAGSKIAIAIHKLNTAANLDQKASFNSLTMAIVKLIRATLYCSNTMDKEGALLKDDAELKATHRSMVANMAKLVISANVASSDTLPDGSSKMQAHSNELLSSVRNFFEICQEHHIKIEPIDPVLSPDMPMNRLSTGNKIKPRQILQSDVISTLQAQQDATTKTLSLLQDIISDIRNKSPNRSRKELVAQFRNCTNQVSQFLNVLQDIEIYKNYPKHPGLLTARQGLYDDLGSIFITVQSMTDCSLATIEDDAHISLWLHRVDEHMRVACEIMQTIVQEYEDMGSVTSDISQRLAFRKARSLSLDKLNGTTISANGPNRTSDGSRDSFASALQLSGLGGLDMDSQPLEPFTTEAELNKILEDDDAFSEDSIESQYAAYPNSKVAPRPVSDSMAESHAEIIAQIQQSITSPDLEIPPSTKQDKLKKFFGEEAAAEAATTGKSVVNDTPSFLGYDYDPAEIVVNMEGDVKGGTLSALTERLTSHKYLDTSFNGTFLLTYRSFCTTDELLSLLEARYNLQPPDGITEEQLQFWYEQKLKLVRLRVFNVLKNWIETYFIDEDCMALQRLQRFANDTMRDTLSFSADQLDKLIKKRQETDDQGGLRKMVLNLGVQAPAPIVPKNMKRLKLLDIDSLELARQLTILDFKLYSSIRPIECLNKAWSKDDARGDIAVNVKSSIEFCNQVTAWVTDTILSQNEIRKRTNVIKYWVQVAERCRQLNNFNTCMAILSAFDNSAIGRLKRTWDIVGARTQHTLAYIRKLMGANKNFTEYREIIHSINPPCIPFLGIYLQDLTFIEDGNSDYLKKSKFLINFSKRMKTAEVIREIQQYQSAPYALEPVKEIQYVIHLNLQNSRDEETLYALSCALEPREREDEKIARLLQESGFL